METKRQDRDILSHQFRVWRRNLHTRHTMVRERSRFVKIKNIKKRNLLYGCFKKQSTQKISNQKMKSKEDVYHNTFITELNKVMDWFKLNRLLLNYKKSQYFSLVPIIQFSMNQNFCYRFYTKSAPIIYNFLKNILI